ncbi:MAG TPA: hypothetical protein VK153_03000 [Candidatus Paceibacterota bacterium]|nr:hypothetical protein [Candidatus Paceibacterota bacterium]
MSRLPTVGQDNNEWGTILNDYLSVEHNEDGTQKLLTESVSRTIYVSATGNDDTGDGSATLPYLTIGKALSTIKKTINSGVIITISLGAGTFDISASDLVVLSSFRSIGGPETITFLGTMVQVDSGFTMGSADANDPLTYTVSGGNTSSWSTNQWKFFMLWDGVHYCPITHNTTTTLSVTYPSTGTSIYENQTIINISSLVIEINISVYFERVRINFTNSISIYSNGKLFKIGECYLYSTGKSISIVEESMYDMGYTAVNSLNFLFFSGAMLKNFEALYLYYNGNIRLISSININFSVFRNTVLENPNTGANACCIDNFGDLTNTTLVTNYYFKFVNSNVCFRIPPKGIYINPKTSNKIIIVNSNYFIRKQSTSDTNYEPMIFSFAYSNIYGTPAVRWFYDQMYEFVNPTSGRNIQITGIIYPEFENNLKYTWNNNTSGSVTVGTTVQNLTVKVTYSISRNSVVERGTVLLTNLADTTVTEVNEIGDCGITWSKAISGSNINLGYVVSNATGNASVTFEKIERTMITPLTI